MNNTSGTAMKLLRGAVVSLLGAVVLGVPGLPVAQGDVIINLDGDTITDDGNARPITDPTNHTHSPGQ